MAVVEIMSGICGFTTIVEATMINKQTVKIKINTECPNIDKITGNLTSVNPYKELFCKLHETQIYKFLCEGIVHPGCLVPAGVLKSVEVASGLALPKDCHIIIKP